MHEIITVQLGQHSNYLATHFWNTQESYFTYAEGQESAVDHDVLWRPGIGADGTETFMPRTVIYDLKGGFGSLRKINALYDVQDDRPPQALWSGPTVVQKQEPIQPSAYQQSLDAGLEPPELTTSTVRYWSDFNRVFFHPRSIIQLNEYELNSALVPFERWSTGEDLFGSLDKEHDLVDRDLRPFAEEADQMQGIQVMTSFDDAWGGFASQYVERLRDEYGKSTIWVWGLQDSFHGISREKRLLRLANKAKTLAEVYKQASLVVPIALPRNLPPNRVSLDPRSQWHVSALISCALETASLPSRLKDSSNRNTLGDMADLLNTLGKQRVASLQMSFPKAQANQRIDSRERQPTRLEPPEKGDDSEALHLDVDFSPRDDLEQTRRSNGFQKPRIFSQLSTHRGSSIEEESNDMAYQDDDLDRRRRDQPIQRRYHTSLAFPILDSFPRIFRDDEGDALNDRVAVTANLTTDTSVSERLKVLRATITRSIGIEDREELSNDLADMGEEYHEGWSTGSDEGDDD